MRQARPLTAALAVVSLFCLSSEAESPEVTGAVADQSIPARVSEEIQKVSRFLERRRTGLTQAEIARVAPALVHEAMRVGLPTDLVVAVIEVESGGHAFARSGAGALGLMQVVPRTGEAVAARIGVRWRGPSTLFDPVANVRVGVSYLAELVDRYGDVSLALAAYNWGPTRIAERLRRGEPVPVVYSRRVFAVWRPRGERRL